MYTCSKKLNPMYIHVFKESCPFYIQCSKKLGSIYIHVFNKIRSYLYTRVQGNWVLIIHTCLRKLGPLYIHVFKESRSYLYTRV